MIKEIIHSVEAWLWRRGFENAMVRNIAKVELLLSALFLLVGLAFSVLNLWFFYFSIGFVVFAWNFCCMAHFILRQTLTAYSSAVFINMLLRFGGRLLVTAVVLYIALIEYSAPASAIVSGLTVGVVVVLLTFAFCGFSGHNRKEA